MAFGGKVFSLHNVRFSPSTAKGTMPEAANVVWIPKMTIKDDIEGPMKKPISHIVMYKALAAFKFL